MADTVPGTSRTLAAISIGLAAASTLSLLAVHVLDPSLDPSWHMVSEYAFGEFGGVLRIFFLCWGFASVGAAAAILPVTTKGAEKLGAALVLVSGLGAIGGGLFDIHHQLHGLAFGLGVPTLPIGALLLTGLLSRHSPGDRLRLRLSAHSTWFGIVLMGVTMGMFIASLKAAGAFNPESKEVLKELPAGVSAVVGYANRFLVLAYLGWVVVAGLALRKTPAAG